MVDGERLRIETGILGAEVDTTGKIEARGMKPVEIGRDLRATKTIVGGAEMTTTGIGQGMTGTLKTIGGGTMTGMNEIEEKGGVGGKTTTRGGLLEARVDLEEVVHSPIWRNGQEVDFAAR